MLPLLSLITAPTSGGFFTQIGVWSTDMFSELLPILYMLVGLLAGSYFIIAIRKGVIGAFKKFAGGGGRRGRRR
jgi:hypothetical protein